MMISLPFPPGFLGPINNKIKLRPNREFQPLFALLLIPVVISYLGKKHFVLMFAQGHNTDTVLISNSSSWSRQCP